MIFWFATIGELNLLSNLTAANENKSESAQYKKQMDVIKQMTKIIEKSYNRKLEKWCSNAKITRKTALTSHYLQLKV